MRGGSEEGRKKLNVVRAMTVEEVGATLGAGEPVRARLEDQSGPSRKR
jgi:hypothetical protein